MSDKSFEFEKKYGKFEMEENFWIKKKDENVGSYGKKCLNSKRI